MDAWITLVIGAALGYLGGFVHRGWLAHKEEQARTAEAARRYHRDHLGGGDNRGTR